MEDPALAAELMTAVKLSERWGKEDKQNGFPSGAETGACASHGVSEALGGGL